MFKPCRLYKFGILLGLILASIDVQACTRILHVFKDGRVLTARSMDWYLRYPVSIWKFPRGLGREGLTPENPAHWTSRFGSVVIVQTAGGDQSATVDGINEKGLVGNLMYLTETDYGERDPEKQGVASSI